VTSALQNERGIMYVVEMQILLARARDQLLRFARERNAHRDAVKRQELAAVYLGVETFRHTCQRTMSKLLRMGMPGPEASIIKLHWTELTQAIPRVGMSMLGPAGLLYDTPEPAKKGNPQEFMQHGFLATPAASIASGTSEIMRGIIAMQVLGLPRGTLAARHGVHAAGTYSGQDRKADGVATTLTPRAARRHVRPQRRCEGTGGRRRAVDGVWRPALAARRAARRGRRGARRPHA
jgi:hypothetical protein